jgi:hypothetical protein
MSMDATIRASNEPCPDRGFAGEDASVLFDDNGGRGDTERSALSLVFSVGVPCGVPVLYQRFRRRMFTLQTS